MLANLLRFWFDASQRNNKYLEQLTLFPSFSIVKWNCCKRLLELSAALTLSVVVFYLHLQCENGAYLQVRIHLCCVCSWQKRLAALNISKQVE